MQTPRRFSPDSVMHIDPAARRSLEIARTMAGERRGSLLWSIDRTATSAGSRLLASRLSAWRCVQGSRD
jgi:DNA mismatch repair protein MutS